MNTSFPKISTRGLALLVAAGLSVPQESVAKELRWLVLEVDSKEMEPDLRRVFSKAMWDTAFEYLPKGHALMPKPAINLQALALAAKCSNEIGQCLAPIANMIGADFVLFANIKGDAERTELFLSLFETESERRRNIKSIMTDFSVESEAELRHHVGVILGSKKPMPPGRIVLAGIERAEVKTLFLDGKKITWDQLESIPSGSRQLKLEGVPEKNSELRFEWKGIVRPARDALVNVKFIKEAIAAPAVAASTIFERFPLSLSFGAATALAAAAGGGSAWRLSVAYNDLLAKQEEVSERCLARGADCKAVTICDVDNPPEECDTVTNTHNVMNALWYTSGALAVGTLTAFIFENWISEPKTGEIKPALLLTEDAMRAELRWEF